MKFSDLNAHEKAVYRAMDAITSEMIGGYENSLEDYAKDSEEYKEAYEFLNQGHEKMAEWFFQYISAEREACKHMKFAGNQFLKDRIEARLNKWGY